MNKRQAKKKFNQKKDAWYVIIEKSRYGGILDPYPCKGYIYNRYFYDVEIRVKYRLKNIKKYVFPCLSSAAIWVEKTYGRWAASHMLKALPFI